MSSSFHPGAEDGNLPFSEAWGSITFDRAICYDRETLKLYARKIGDGEYRLRYQNENGCFVDARDLDADEARSILKIVHERSKGITLGAVDDNWPSDRGGSR